MILKDTCWDCGVKIGEYHNENCDVERCPGCGNQLLCCGLECQDVSIRETIWAKRKPFSGKWPGTIECEEFNLWSYWGPPWIKCDKDHPKATHDLNSLYAGNYKWDIEQQRFV